MFEFRQDANLEVCNERTMVENFDFVTNYIINERNPTDFR
jgi:hypothetical protein